MLVDASRFDRLGSTAVDDVDLIETPVVRSLLNAASSSGRTRGVDSLLPSSSKRVITFEEKRISALWECRTSLPTMMRIDLSFSSQLEVTIKSTAIFGS
jgi:hypothetical protein